MKNVHKLELFFWSLHEYKLFASTHINPFVFVVGSIIIVVPISHGNIKSSNYSPTMTDMFLESIQLGRQEFSFLSMVEHMTHFT
jgi:hypothetical protein